MTKQPQFLPKLIEPGVLPFFFLERATVYHPFAFVEGDGVLDVQHLVKHHIPDQLFPCFRGIQKP
jgi:hypothetical protein